MVYCTSKGCFNEADFVVVPIEGKGPTVRFCNECLNEVLDAMLLNSPLHIINRTVDRHIFLEAAGTGL